MKNDLNLYQIAATIDSKLGRHSYEVNAFVVANDEKAAEEAFNRNLEEYHTIHVSKCSLVAVSNSKEAQLRNHRVLILDKGE